MKPHPKGAVWEALAEKFLADKGLKIITRNFHCRLGEVDLVMRHGNVTVFIEVKYRASSRFGLAMETVSRSKQLKIARAAGIFLSRRPAFAEGPCRFDVVSIDGNPEGDSFNWIPGAFEIEQY